MTRDLIRDLTLAALLTGFCIVARLVDHAPNFAPVAAAALFAAFACRDRRIALAVPLVAMLASDMVIGFYPLPILIAVYAMLVMPVALGRWVGRGRTALRVGSFALGHALAYFAVTNFAVWAFAGMYPKTPAGLLLCFEQALPFFRWTLESNLLYTGVFFGLHAVSTHLARRDRAALPAAA